MPELFPFTSYAFDMAECVLTMRGHGLRWPLDPLYHYQLDVAHGCWICYVLLDTKVAQTWWHKIYIYYCSTWVSAVQEISHSLAGSFAYFPHKTESNMLVKAMDSPQSSNSERFTSGLM